MKILYLHHLRVILKYAGEAGEPAQERADAVLIVVFFIQHTQSCQISIYNYT